MYIRVPRPLLLLLGESQVSQLLHILYVNVFSDTGMRVFGSKPAYFTSRVSLKATKLDFCDLCS